MAPLLAQATTDAPGIPALDLVVIAVYFAVIMAVGILPVLHTKMTGNAYFLAGRSLHWPVVGAALFASNISTIHLVGLAEGGFKDGMVIGNFEWMASFTLIGLALVFAPFYFQSKIATLPEYLERRYHPVARSIMAFLAIMAALLIHIGISLYAGAEVFELFFGIDPFYSILIVSLMTAVYTVIGGLTAVVVTETLQTVILLAGAVIVTLLAASQLPDAGINSWAELREAVGENHVTMLRTETVIEQPGVVPQPYPFVWYAFVLGYPVLGVWYWCSDQTIVQRVLGAKTQLDAQRGALFAGVLKVLPPFLMVLPGVFAYALFRDEINAADVGAAKTLPYLINELVPTGLKGLIAAALLAALMSTIAAALNSTGSLVALDIVTRLYPETSDKRQVFIGRVSAVVVMLLAMAWSTQGDKFGSIFEAINKMPAQFLAPPIATVFVWGFFWRRGTTAAAITTLIVGFSVGMVVFILDLPLVTTYTGPKLVETNGVASIQEAPLQLVSEKWGIPFMMQAWWGFCLCTVLYVAVSFATPAPSAEQVEGLTWKNPLACVMEEPWTGVTDPRALALMLAGLMVLLYATFG